MVSVGRVLVGGRADGFSFSHHYQFTTLVCAYGFNFGCYYYNLSLLDYYINNDHNDYAYGHVISNLDESSEAVLVLLQDYYFWVKEIDSRTCPPTLICRCLISSFSI